MKKGILIYASILTFLVCCSSDKRSKTALPANNIILPIEEETNLAGPGSAVRSIKQDRNGNIWMTSWEGIYRYDGKSFTNMTKTVSKARFFSLLEDRHGNFWFGSIGSGVYYYNGKSFQNFTTKDGLLNNDVISIYEDRKGDIWFGVFGGASRYDGQSFRNYIINGDAMEEDLQGKTLLERAPYDVNCIIEDKKGKIWFATRGKTYVYDGKTFNVVTNNGIPFLNVRTLMEDKKGNVWLGGTRYDGTTFKNITQNSVLHVYEDNHENIWISSVATSNQKWILSRYEVTSNNSKAPMITEINQEIGPIFTILEAYDGSMWLGSTGVYRYDGKTFHHFKSKALAE